MVKLPITLTSPADTPSAIRSLLVSACASTSGSRAALLGKDTAEMKSIGKYQVIEALGASATGQTYRVRDAFRNREFAVKILESVPGISDETKEQFCAYLASCSELTHRHIAKVYDLGVVEEGIFVATEWRNGVDLKRFMEENRELALDQKLGVIAQVAEGLGFAHSRGMAHGNLKPANIFVDASRDAAILDFGVAKWLAAVLDAGGRPAGLVANYLAPEQILGQPFDARSDIFALGVMLYELVSGEYPFSADAGLIPREIVHSDPATLRSIDSQIPEGLETLVARTLAKDPAQRLQTAEEFASGLYLTAQQFRRAANAAAVEPLSPPSTDALAEHLPPALTVTPPPVAQPVPTPPSPPIATTPAMPEPRQRPQDAPSEARAWTARSYEASAPLSLSTNPPPATERAPASPPPPPMNPPAPRSAEPAYQPAYQAPKSFIKPVAPRPAPAAPKPKKLGKGVLVAVVGLVLAVAFLGSFVSRQNLKASESRQRNAAAAAPKPVSPAPAPVAAPAPAPPAARAAKPQEPTPAEAVNPEVSAKQILNGPVRTLWESGRYAQALALVNQVLTTDPANEEARSWKKKIREAQAAEAALK